MLCKGREISNLLPSTGRQKIRAKPHFLAISFIVGLGCKSSCRAMEITNQSKKPLSIPLPGGKKLFLGPGKSGQINWKAADRPAVQKLIKSGEVSISREAKKGSKAKGVARIDTDAPSYTGSYYSAHWMRRANRESPTEGIEKFVFFFFFRKNLSDAEEWPQYES